MAQPTLHDFATGQWMLRDIGNCAMMPANSSRFSYLYGAMKLTEFLSRVGNQNPNCQQLYEIARNLKNGGRADFLNNLRASLFNKYHSNEPNFSESISLDSTFKNNCFGWELIYVVMYRFRNINIMLF